MTSPANIRPLQFGVTSPYGAVDFNHDTDTPQWGTRQQAVWALNALQALYPDVPYRLTKRSTPMMDCPDCGRLLTLTEDGPECRHCEETE